MDVFEDVISLSSVEVNSEEVLSLSAEPLYDFLAEDMKLYELTLAQILSSSDLLINEIDAMLSSIPIHPYDRLKAEYLGPDCPTISLNDIEVPECFCLSSVSCQITNIAERYSDLFDLQIQALSTDKIDQVYSAFAMPSGEDFVIDKDKTANHLQYVDMVNNIPLHLVDENPMLVAQKLLTQYIKMY